MKQSTYCPSRHFEKKKTMNIRDRRDDELARVTPWFECYLYIRPKQDTPQ